VRKILISLLLVSFALSAGAQMAAPGAEHKVMEQLVGHWTGTATLQLPGMEPMTSEVKISHAMELGGFWLIGSFEGSMMGVPFTGRSTLGFDSEKGKYVEIWVDSMRSSVSQLEGDYDAATRSWTKWLDTKHPMSGEPIKERHIVAMTDDDHFKMELALPGPDGEYVPYMVLEQARAE
jgi:hypothetical protein